MSNDQTDDKSRLDLNLKERKCKGCDSCKCDKNKNKAK